jgi:hypothetical protein
MTVLKSSGCRLQRLVESTSNSLLKRLNEPDLKVNFINYSRPLPWDFWHRTFRPLQKQDSCLLCLFDYHMVQFSLYTPSLLLIHHFIALHDLVLFLLSRLKFDQKIFKFPDLRVFLKTIIWKLLTFRKDPWDILRGVNRWRLRWSKKRQFFNVWTQILGFLKFIDFSVFRWFRFTIRGRSVLVEVVVFLWQGIHFPKCLLLISCRREEELEIKRLSRAGLHLDRSEIVLKLLLL